MAFNSLKFIIFFPVVVVLYFLTPQRHRWALLLLANFIFYISFAPLFIFVLLFTILITYFGGIFIENSPSRGSKKIGLAFSIIGLCLPLFIFKYFNFFAVNFCCLLKLFRQAYTFTSLAIMLPIGLSFFTLKSLSYVIEVYRGNLKTEKHLGLCALYVSFFPQIVSGPIERPYNLIPQFQENHKFDFLAMTDGLKLMIFGFLKKLVIADRLGYFVNQVYSQPQGYQGISLIVATVFFSFQIYCDLSGYSDIAIGASQIMGFKTMDNFKRPYAAFSITEFWRRWHISLSSWFRDYLYIPLGGNRVSSLRHYANIFITFLISGFWHGANWTFIIWGGLNGFFLIMELITKNIFDKAFNVISPAKFGKFVQNWAVFILITFAWVFFRSNNINDALYIITHLFKGGFQFINGIIINRAHILNDKMLWNPVLLNQPLSEFLIAVIFIIFMEFIQFMERKGETRHMFRGLPAWLSWPLLYIMICGILFFGEFNQSRFIYAQF